MRVAALVAFAILLPVQEPADISRWIADLGHEEPARRDAAQAHLLKAGEKALPELRRALTSKDAEVVARLRAIIDEAERPGREREHDAQRRPRQLSLVTLDLAKSKLSLVLAAIEKESPVRFKSVYIIDPDVSVIAKDAPLRKVLDSIEDQIDAAIRVNPEGVYVVSPGRPSRNPRLYLPGATLEFTTRPAKVGDKVVGRRIQVSEEGTSRPSLGAWEAFGADGKARDVEICEVCGPKLILVRGDPKAELKIRTRSSFVWTSPYELGVTNPELSQSFKVGGFTVTYRFPNVTITSHEDVPSELFPHATLSGESQRGVGISLSFDVTFEKLQRTPDPEGWCDCPRGPKPPVVKTPATRRSSVGTTYEHNRAGDFESMKVLFYKPIQESFEGEVVIPAE
jgi:hypothetical protein